MIKCCKCHTCGTRLRIVLDGEEWCPTCETYWRYHSHGWTGGRYSEPPDEGCPPEFLALPEPEQVSA